MDEQATQMDTEAARGVNACEDGHVRIGTAGWTVPRQYADAFSKEGSSLERYGRVLHCAEINSTFYRSSRASTYARWAASVPEDFRFSVKAPKAITHECALAPTEEQVRAFFEELAPLRTKLGPILFQLPPRQAFDESVAWAFLGLVRRVYPEGAAVLEPRHASWFCAEADALLREARVARVVADPARASGGTEPGGEPSLVYYRLHGSPRMYYSSYAPEWLAKLAATMKTQAQRAEVWCVFDNTASGAALGDALRLTELLVGRESDAS